MIESYCYFGVPKNTWDDDEVQLGAKTNNKFLSLAKSEESFNHNKE